MRPLHLIGAVAVVAGIWQGTCRGATSGEFTINLKLQAGQREQTAVSGKPASARPVFPAKVKEVVSVQWSAVNGALGAILSDVTFHVFMDRGSASADAPKPGPNALYESAVILDFKPGSKSSGEFRMLMPESGTYLVRVETIGATKKLGREVAAAMQVSVQ
jgi:hypothetical protein